MLVSVPLHLDSLPGRPQASDLEDVFAAHYGDESEVRLVRAGTEADRGRLEAESLNGTNRLEIRVFGSASYPQAVLVAKLDNLGKGASSAAVQSMRLMLGLG
jgi:N-acetyl-gamma-glutamyl-phosphate reductase